MSNPDKRLFDEMLLGFSQEPNADRRKEIEKSLWKSFGTEQAIMVLDMSGFSQLTQRFGVVHYLSMVRRMQLTATPIIESYGGRVVKFEADNCFASFPDPLGAVRSGISLNLAFGAANILTPEELDIRIACGIDYGEILSVDSNDFFGNAVNRASKLGEDSAGPGEILVTDDAVVRIPQQAGIEFEPLTITISGIEIESFKVIYRQ